MITVPDSQSELEFRFMGYEPRNIKVGNQTTINVSLEEATSSLEEVVVVAEESDDDRIGSFGEYRKPENSSCQS